MKEKKHTRSSLFSKKLRLSLLAGILLSSTLVNAQVFVSPEEVPFNLEPMDVFQSKLSFVDIDNDGDLDFFSGFDENAVILFQENIGTAEAPDFADTLSNPFGINPSDGLISPIFADIDNDGDYDLLASTYLDGTTMYFENTGTAELPEFGTDETEAYGLSFYYFISYNFVDMDNDGDLDLMGSQVEELTDEVRPAFVENIGTVEAPEFDTPTLNPFGLTEVYEAIPMAEFVDIDADGDLDFFVNFIEASTIYYYENIGTPADASWEGVDGVEDPFGIGSLAIDEGFGSSTLVDIDNDGDLDFFASIVYGPTIYYENRSIVLGVDEESEMVYVIRVYPNPATESIWIATDLNPENCSQIIIYGIDGQKKFETQKFTQEIDIATFENGMYIVQLVDMNGNVEQMKFVKQ